MKRVYYRFYLKDLQHRVCTDKASFKSLNHVWKFSYDEESLEKVYQCFPYETDKISKDFEQFGMFISFCFEP